MSERIVTFHVVSIIYTISSVYIVIVYAFGYRSAHIKKTTPFFKGSCSRKRIPAIGLEPIRPCGQ
jgi:hypothetical protein